MKAKTYLLVGTPSIVELHSGPSNAELQDLHAYWLSKKGARIAPPRSVIQPEEISRSLLPYIALVDVVGEPPWFRVRLFGTGLVRAYGEDVTGKYLEEMGFGLIAEDVRAGFIQVVDECRSMTVRGQLTKENDQRYLQYERIALPLSQDGVRVNMILCGFAVIRVWH